jgi:transcription elongation factor GreB
MKPRQPDPKKIEKNNLITPAGYDRMYAELRKLADEDRPVLLEEIAAAAAQGDRSENAEYIYGRKKLREVDKRINFLKGRLERAKIIDPKRQSGDKVDFGATVTIQDDEGRSKTWTILGEDEADPSSGKISWLSPLGRALMNKLVGDYTEAETPRGPIEYQVKKVIFEG